jgi:short-subunit dehydrogenase
MASTALVTGAGSGIGRGLALALARRGYHILAVGRDLARLQAVAHEIEQISSAAVFSADLAEAQPRARFIEEVLERFGPPDLLVNNAALRPAGDFLTQSIEEIDRAFTLNLVVPALLARQLCPLPGGAAPLSGVTVPLPRGILFVISTAARFPQPYTSLYSASKSGLRMLGECLQVELAGRTRVCLVYPPLTATPMTEQARMGGRILRIANAATVAERIITRYEAGQDEITWRDWEVIPSLLYRLAPAFMRWLLKKRRAQLKNLLIPPGAQPE